jgi:hypothetical protein
LSTFCVLYWAPAKGWGRYANVNRRNVAVKRDGRWVSAVGRDVRRLGGPPSRRARKIRELIASPSLNKIYHPTNGGGAAPLFGYSCTDSPRGCNYVSAADAPPNTSQGGKGYSTGVYRSGTTFHTTDRAHRVPVFRSEAPWGMPRFWGMARWVYGFIRTRRGPVWGWVIHSVRIKEPNGQVTTYPGYLR